MDDLPMDELPVGASMIFITFCSMRLFWIATFVRYSKVLIAFL